MAEPVDDTVLSAQSDAAGEESHRESLGRYTNLAAVFAGFLLVYAGLVGMWFIWGAVRDRKFETTADMVVFGIASLFVLIVFLVGARVLSSAFAGQTVIIGKEDRNLLEPLIASANDKAIEQYVRLSSLTGATGTATKLGLTGLPLVTVALTIFFCFLEIYRPNMQFMDLAKLTLGAFIGSFVQRAVSTQAAAEAVSSGRMPKEPV